MCNYQYLQFVNIYLNNLAYRTSRPIPAELGWCETGYTPTVHTHIHTMGSQLGKPVCLWTVGENWKTWRKPTQTWGKHGKHYTERSQSAMELELEPRCCAATMLSTTPPSKQTKKQTEFCLLYPRVFIFFKKLPCKITACMRRTLSSSVYKHVLPHVAHNIAKKHIKPSFHYKVKDIFIGNHLLHVIHKP